MEHTSSFEAIDMVLIELTKAIKKHPVWPKDLIHATAIMAEETGEAVQAALDCVYLGGDIDKLINEVAQSGAMAIRILMNLPSVSFPEDCMIDAAGNHCPCDPPPFVHADKSFPTDGGMIREMYKR